MATNNSLQPRQKFSVVLQSDAYKKLINDTLQDKNTREKFIADISTAVSLNPSLQECEPNTIVSAGLVATTLKLSLSSSMGEAYLVPFRDNRNNRTVCQFQVGYIGLKQLAIRSGQYKRIVVKEIYEGEFKGYDKLTCDPIIVFNESIDRANGNVIGYYAYYELLNGYFESLYMSKEDMEHHAITYSKGYAAKKGYTFWEKNFDAMARKTLLRQLFKTAPKSIDFISAYEKDQAVIDSNGVVDYVDNAPEDAEPVKEEPKDEVKGIVEELSAPQFNI